MPTWMGINENYTYYRIRHRDGEERVLVAGERGIRQSCRRHTKAGKDCHVFDDEGNSRFFISAACKLLCKK